MLASEQVSRSIAKDELGLAGWCHRLAIRLHLLVCRHCRRYARQIEVIGAET